jgi:site-specific DNA recombinase
VIQAYEARIEKLERQKIMLSEQAEQTVPPQGRFEEFIEHAMEFLASPCNIYEKGSFALKRTVLKLAFAEPLRYKRNEGYRTAKTTFTFKVLADFSTPKCGMVAPIGVEPMTYRLGGGCSIR